VRNEGIPVKTADGAWTVDRRTALKLMGTTLLTLSSAVGCTRKPPREVVSREAQPESLEPGRTLHYASTWTEGWYPYGILVTCVDGRPIKIEGNPEHPVNAGRSNAAMQASVVSLYDPLRLRNVSGAASLEEADARIREALGRAASIVLVTGSLLGPSERAAVGRFLERYPAARWFVFEAFSDRERRETWRELTGREGVFEPRLEEARVVLSVGSDFLQTDGPELRLAREFAEARARASGTSPQLRLYVAEADLSLTGTVADQRIRIRPSQALTLLELLRAGVRGEDVARRASEKGFPPAVVQRLVADLRENRGRAVVLAGPQFGRAVHAAASLLNDEIGALGRTLLWNPSPPRLVPDDPADLEAALAEGVDVLLLLGVDPAYHRPAFAELARQARLTVTHALFPNPTTAASDLVIPSHHNLESWGDARPAPGIWSFVQPAVRPLHATRQPAESLLRWALGEEAPPFRDLVRETALRGPLSGAPFPSRAWTEALQRGVVTWTEAEPPVPRLARQRAESLVAAGRARERSEGYDVWLAAHPTTYDGRFAHHPYLLEVPDPVTKEMWGNAARIAPETAAALGLTDGDEVELSLGNQVVRMPVLRVPGVAPGVVCVSPGFGRATFLDRKRAVGVNAWALAEGDQLCQEGVGLRRLGRRAEVVLSQETFSMEGRPIVLQATAAELARDPQVIQRRRHRPAENRLYPSREPTEGHRWAMAIDLARCIGCQACVLACQVENNIPVVGREEAAKGREMHWIRIDQYREGDGDGLVVHHQPMPCQHCGEAPCENVCPVNATNHDAEGLNVMVYNRCIGTRYCANNCPYKVRRFNFFDYARRTLQDPLQVLGRNPDVTVRQRGVMEKCTFCIQRINAGKFRARAEGRDLRDGEIVPACAQACPTDAIVFGDRNLQRSRVRALEGSPRAFRVLEELRVEPAVTYLARVRNPGQESAGPEPAGRSEG
jgi:molybdopterin-containing oxidoreductase family iron-sulfur binding subunit